MLCAEEGVHLGTGERIDVGERPAMLVHSRGDCGNGCDAISHCTNQDRVYSQMMSSRPLSFLTMRVRVAHANGLSDKSMVSEI